MRSNCLQTLFISFLCIAAVNAPLQAETYIYQEEDGTRWLTDRPMNPDKFKFINKFGRPTATRSCKGVTSKILERRAQTYMPTVIHLAEKHELDALLIKAVITVESCFDARASSRAGAHGLMQLMPATARQYGVYDRFNPNENLRAGIEHLRELLDYFDNHLPLSLAAYNAGTGNVEKYNGIPPFKETQGYVKKVLKYYEKYSGKNKVAEQPDTREQL